MEGLGEGLVLLFLGAMEFLEILSWLLIFFASVSLFIKLSSASKPLQFVAN